MTADARVTCEGSGTLAKGLKVAAKIGHKAKTGATTLKTMKVICPTCGRRVGTIKRRAGEHKGMLTVESHWVPRPRVRRELAADAAERELAGATSR